MNRVEMHRYSETIALAASISRPPRSCKSKPPMKLLFATIIISRFLFFLIFLSFYFSFSQHAYTPIVSWRYRRTLSPQPSGVIAIIVSNRVSRVRQTRTLGSDTAFINNETDVALRGTHHFEENLPMSARESSRNKLKKKKRISLSLCL